MTTNQIARAIITGSYMTYLIDKTMGRESRARMSTIRLRQKILKRITKKEYIEYVILSNKSWDEMIDCFDDENPHNVYSFDAIEFLYYHEDKVMMEFFGKDIDDLVGRFAMKNSIDVIDKEMLRQSREIIDKLTEITKKVIFDYEKDKKDI